MSINHTELQPDVDEVLQTEPAGAEPVVKVAVDGPVRVQSLPRKAGATFTRTVPDTAPTRLLFTDHRRAAATIQSEDNIWIGYSQAAVQSAIDNAVSNGAYRLLGTGPQFHTEVASEIWVCGAVGSAKVSVATEMWAVSE